MWAEEFARGCDEGGVVPDGGAIGEDQHVFEPDAGLQPAPAGMAQGGPATGSLAVQEHHRQVLSSGAQVSE